MISIRWGVLFTLLLTSGETLRAEPQFTPLYKPTCFASACHVYTPGGAGAGIWIEHINGVATGVTTGPYSVTVLPGQSFTVDFRAKGMTDPVTKKDPDVTGLITVEANQFWAVSAGPTWTDGTYSNATPWKLTSTANQTYISNFLASESTNNKLCATTDTGSAAAPADKNGKASDEVMSATIQPAVYVGSGPHSVTITVLGYHHDYGAGLLQVPITVNVLAPTTPVNSVTVSQTPTRTASFSPSPSFSITPTVLPVSACAGTAYMGNAIIGPQNGLRNNQATCMKVTSTATGILNSVSIYFTVAPTSVRIACYADAGGTPGALLSESVSQAAGVGWNSLALPAVGISPGVYWLAWQQTGGIPGGQVPYDYKSFKDAYAFAQAYGAFATTALAGGTYYQQTFPLVASLCVAGTATFTSTVTLTTSPSPSFTATPTATKSSTPSDTSSSTASPTFSPTVTPTFTDTSSATPSFSSTVTPSSSATLTFSSTATLTVTPTWTNTASPSPTFSSTMTASPTATQSSTSTSTASPTATSTISPSPSFTATLTWTSVPPGSTATNTPSITPTFSVSPTFTSTATASPSATSTATTTPTATASSSSTSTATPSSTSTASPSATYSATPSFSSTATLTDTPSSTASPSDTASITATYSHTASATASATATSSATPSATSSVSPSSTATSTSSPSPSDTATSTFSPSATATPSYSASPSFSVTPTISVTFTVSPTSTNSPIGTAVPSATRTPLPNNSFTSVLAPVLAPNPSFGNTCTLSYQLVADTDNIQVRFYTTALTLAGVIDLGPRPVGLDIRTLTLPEGLSNQLYYVQLRARTGRQEVTAKVVPLYVLR